MTSIFFRAFILLLAFVVSWLQVTSAFDPLSPAVSPEIRSAYARTQEIYETKYQTLQKNFPTWVFSDEQKARLSRAESRITNAYRALSIAQLPRTQKIAQRNLSFAIRRLDTLLLSMSRESIVVQPIRTPNIPIPLAESASWNGATEADFLYYADTFQDGRTANGDTFRHEGFSGARCNIPLGTLAQLRYADKAVTVKLNDRPNCTKHPDIIDLTRTAFMSLGRLSQGRLGGSFIPLEILPSGLMKEYLPTDFFAPLWVTLAPETPNIYLPGDTLTLRGTTIDQNTESLIYVVEPDGNIVSYGQDSPIAGALEYFIPLTKIGKYELVVASGRSFSGAKSLNFTVLDPKTVALKKYFGNTSESSLQFETERLEASDLTPTNVVRVLAPNKNTLYTLRLKSDKWLIEASGQSTIAIDMKLIESVRTWSSAQLDILAQNSSTPYSIDTYTPRKLVSSQSVTLAPLYKAEKNIPFETTVNDSALRITLGNTPAKISANAYIITPSGAVDMIKFDPKYLATDGTLAINNGAYFTYSMREVGVYLVEVNYDTGFAAVVTPVTYGPAFPILPNILDLTSRSVESTTTGIVDRTLENINSLRAKQSLGTLTVDPTLTRLAQAKADDMGINNYVGHTDSTGVKIDGTAKRLGIPLKWAVGENVAGGTVSFAYLQAGLSLSWGHRLNMLKPSWSKVGIGVTIRNGKTSFVQVFGE